MYHKIEGGTQIDIQGLLCNIPPIGYVFNSKTEKFDYIGVYRRSDKDEDCYWEIPKKPIWYDETMKRWAKFEKDKKDEDAEFYDEKLEEFKIQEWHRRLNGFWFQNNDKPTYITGLNYYYLCYWKIDIGSPKFRIPDVEKSYFLQYCIEDDKCLGMTEVTKRRFGKSYYAGCFLIESITKTKMAFGGIQSKTGKDAQKFFGKTVVNPFRKLPQFFRPVYDTSLGANPKTEMRFQRPNVRGKKSQENIQDDELGGAIDWQSADTMAYDGQKLFVTIQDECYKTSEVNIYDRHEVIRYCLLDDESNVIGKALYTSTVEQLDTDKDGVNIASKMLWDDSDQNNRQENGMTSSGLYRFFMSAKRTRNFDKYGYPNEELTEKQILADRESIKNNTRALSKRIKKEPLTVAEAFSISSLNCLFNDYNINNQREYLKEINYKPRQVTFYREFNTGKVTWRDDKEGYCYIAAFPPDDLVNKFEYIDGKKSPLNKGEYAFSIDSYANSQSSKKYGSNAAGFMYRKFDLTDPENTGLFVAMYFGRPKEKTDLHEQIMLMAEYYGTEAHYEFTSDDFYTYFKERGMLKFLGKFPKSSIDPNKKEPSDIYYGFPISPFAMTKSLDSMISYIQSHCNKVYFDILLEQLLIFDANNRTSSDAVVAASNTLVCSLNQAVKKEKINYPLIKIY